MAGRRGGRFPKKPKSHEKRIPYKILSRESGAGKSLYKLLDNLVEEHHEELEQAKARIMLAWALNWKADADGNRKLGRCKKASDLDRELAAWDFVILLNQSWVEDAEVTEAQRAALIDHELCHATTRVDKNGEPIVDERGRTVFRMRKHDLEEFSEIVQRHGLWKKDLENMARAMTRTKQGRLFLEKEAERIGGKPKPADTTPSPAATH